MATLDRRVYLASKSPRRRELLKQIGVNFELLMLRSFPETRADVLELPVAGEAPADSATRIARTKAENGWLRAQQRGLPNHPVLGGDTVVALDGEFLAKPKSAADAAEMLARLSGRVHEVHTAVALGFENEVNVLLSTTRVELRELSAQEIRNYVATGEPMDKAGAYGVQGRAATFIVRIDGSYSGVMGLPLYETAQLLKNVGVNLL